MERQVAVQQAMQTNFVEYFLNLNTEVINLDANHAPTPVTWFDGRRRFDRYVALDGGSYEILDGPMQGIYVNLAETQNDAVAGRPSECETWTGHLSPVQGIQGPGKGHGKGQRKV